ncbi:hypothetical protein [Rickettsia amblyommatis]|nr:hypothetical protein [Rickettsia amblyommatis]
MISLKKGVIFIPTLRMKVFFYMISGVLQLSRAKNLPWSEVKEMAKEDYEYWFGRSKSFLLIVNTH